MHIPENAVTLIDEVLAKANQFQKMAQQRLENRSNSPLSAPSVDQCLSCGEEVRSAVLVLGFRWCDFDPVEYHGSVVTRHGRYYVKFVAKDRKRRKGQFVEVPEFLCRALNLTSIPWTQTKGDAHQVYEEMAGLLINLMHRLRGLAEAHLKSSTRLPGIDHKEGLSPATEGVVSSNEVSFQHSPDYSCVKWRGCEFTFTSTQREAIQYLHEQFQEGTDKIGQHAVLDAIKQNGKHKRLRDLFRAKGKDHPAWGTLIEPLESPRDMIQLNF